MSTYTQNHTEEDLDKATYSWTGTYKGLNWKVSHHGYSEYNNYGTWCYYIYLPEEIVPDTFEKQFWLPPEEPNKYGGVSYRYEDAVFNSYEFEGGVTFYKKHGGFDNHSRSVEIGCDFAHLWDEGNRHTYRLQWIKTYTENSIDLFREYNPDSLHRCSWNGNYYPESEFPNGTGRPSKEGEAQRTESRAKP